MSRQLYNFRIEEELLKKMRYFCGVSEQKIGEFINEAISEKCEKVQHLRSGGATITIPNPQIMGYNGKDTQKIVTGISEAARIANTTNGGLDFGLNEILTFANQRLHKDTLQQAKQFQANFENDGENTGK